MGTLYIAQPVCEYGLSSVNMLFSSLFPVSPSLPSSPLSLLLLSPFLPSLPPFFPSLPSYPLSLLTLSLLQTSHKKTFLYLEQLILKHCMHTTAVKVREASDGLDFFFAQRQEAIKADGGLLYKLLFLAG